jgi:hypothetical protein
MNDLVQFAKRLKEELERSSREPFWTGDDAQRYMAEVAARREQFTTLATHWIQTIALPRLETMAGYFANAALGRHSSDDRCNLRFRFIERFPASAEVSIAVEHDLRYEQVLAGGVDGGEPLRLTAIERFQGFAVDVHGTQHVPAHLVIAQPLQSNDGIFHNRPVSIQELQLEHRGQMGA